MSDTDKNLLHRTTHFFGTDAVGFALGLDDAAPCDKVLNSLDLSQKQLEALVTINQMLMQGRLQLALSSGSFSGFSDGDFLCDQIARTFPHPFAFLREACGGTLPRPSIVCPISQAIAEMSNGAYPAFLIKAARLRYGGNGLFPGPLSFHGTPELSAFVSLFLADADFSAVLSNTASEHSDPGMRCLKMLHDSSGRGGSVQICIFPEQVILTAFLLMRVRDKRGLKTLHETIAEQVRNFRSAIRGETVPVPAFVGFTNVSLPEGAEIEVRDGVLRPVSADVALLLPPSARRTKNEGCILETTYDYRIHASDHVDPEARDGRSGFEPVMPTMEQSQRKLNQLAEDIVATFTFAIEREPPVGVSRAWQCVVTILNGGNFSWTDSVHGGVPKYDFTQDKIQLFQEWQNRVSRLRQAMPVAMRRIQSALTRRNIDDAFVDAMIACDSAFGEAFGELKFRISMAMACLLTSDAQERMELQKEIGDLYTLRSKVVHGVASRADNIVTKRNRILSLVIDCLRLLAKERPHLLTSKNRATRIIAGDVHTFKQDAADGDLS